jgi:hypothetical protein
MVTAYAVDPPLRIGKARDLVLRDRASNVGALAQVPAKQRVRECLGAGPDRLPRRGDRAIDDGEWRRPRVIELVERNGEERAQERIGDRLPREGVDDRGQRSPVPQRSVGKLLDQCPAAQRTAVVDGRERVAQVRAIEDAHDGECRQRLLAMHG